MHVDGGGGDEKDETVLASCRDAAQNDRRTMTRRKGERMVGAVMVLLPCDAEEIRSPFLLFALFAKQNVTPNKKNSDQVEESQRAVQSRAVSLTD